ncbi:unnamed protein product [Didymodactylos carnosus]|uniref:Uncharacterized protein n=1 Tax=Didymodactylos carnosus TaxID=1234261 RepID=A0A8S2FDI2_9BILA|nr:unnamed protein product [Didymodactylos carnosus]CAF4232323.1 unnamed protein product [Didymodactylos carnosus]
MNSNDNNKQLFLSSFIDNITNNLSKSKNNYRYNDSIKRFAVSLYILDGKLTYELVRINQSHLSTVNKIIANTNFSVKEGEFKFDGLNKYLISIAVQFSFGSEDCTDVIHKIKYDVNTNSFIDFSIRLTMRYQLLKIVKLIHLNN